VESYLRRRERLAKASQTPSENNDSDTDIDSRDDDSQTGLIDSPSKVC
jgi:hypothetical protein